MVWAILSDIHGNAPALRGCLQRLQQRGGIDRVYFLGDAVGYFFNVNEVIDLLRKQKVECLLGNHDAMLLNTLPVDQEKEAAYQISRNRDAITSANLGFLSSLLPFRAIDMSGLRMLLVHGSPRNPLLEYVYEDSPLHGYSQMGYDLIFMGHTHRPFVRNDEACVVVNVGSVGLPRDIGNMGSYALLDTATSQVTIERFEIDVEEVLKQNDGVHESVKDCLRRN